MQAGGRGDIVPMGEGLGSELLMESAIKETQRRRITVTSSSHDPRISWEIRRGWGGGGVTPSTSPFSMAGLWTE